MTSHGAPPDSAPDTPIVRSRRPEWSEWSLVISGVVSGLLSGAALGVLWWRLAPRATVAVRPDGASPQGYQPEEYLAADVSFVALALVAGLVLTVALAVMRRGHLLGVLVAGLLASAVGTLAMWQVGTRLGSVDLEGRSATTSEESGTDAPLEVTMPGVYLVWSISAATVVLVLAISDWLVARRSGHAD